MSPKSIWPIDKWAALCRHPCHNCNVERGLTKAVRSFLLVDSQIQAKDSAIAMGACLEPEMGETDPRRDYAVLKHWYRHASARAPNPPQTDTEKLRGDFQTLYQQEEPHPPGLPLATHVDPAQMNNATPSEAEVEISVF